MKGKDDRYEAYKGSIYQSLFQKTPTLGVKRSQLRESNDRLKTLQDLDRRREEQLKKEFAALDMRRKQQEEETQRRINLKKVRLAETGYLNTNLLMNNNIGMRGIPGQDMGQQHRFVTLVYKKE